eukprot:CAMPEP_0113539290 /NCGR_PEP_ID=MMETSP0015_2-20120614/7835_1 /TAXON_ID=2838 /ORGANISM="Odontella" /LENGTH=707 /DNA_ID=CAMNT_0000438951 /DNA_START=88 /DNA_END=2211 /DNA_ORIENTATION=- /assembly_acc=CAM_ASM_000160
MSAPPSDPSSSAAPPPPPPPPSESYPGEKALSARELEWAVNSPSLLEEHRASNGSIVRTRFPPEPNGFLHIGHAKSMNMNFSLAFEKLGVPLENRRTVFRYDDTNPDAESEEYIDSLRRDMEWMGWKPERTTYSSDNFETLHNLAVRLIERGLAYVCDMSKDEMEAQRDLARRRVGAIGQGKDPDVEAPISDPDILPGRNRDTSVERNLRMFEEMRLGLHAEGSMTLRLKMDFESSNPNMYDLVAYRIKYTSHPHAGPGRCLYPAYDFTHGICDSLERIDYSICTLEFETRREPYYWILWALDMYKPKVYEMSRLNLEYTVLSKRRLLKLVNKEYVRGWDDPRMPTISGLRRRGYTADILNSFCNDVGATRAMNVVEMEKLDQTARLKLGPSSRRAMAALDPIKVIITNFDDADPSGEGLTFDVNNSPTDESMGSHRVSLTSTIYIDSSDFRLKDAKTYYGLAPNKAVGLKYYGGNMFCTDVVKDAKGKVTELKCTLDKSEGRKKPKSFITWVPSDGIPCEVRVYGHLFTVPEPTDRWEEEVNPKSEAVHPNAIIDPSVKDAVDASRVDRWTSNPALQFERLGYFVVDVDTAYSSSSNSGGKLVFNRTVSLKAEIKVHEKTPAELAAIEARRSKAKADEAAKKERLKISPEDFFKLAAEFKDKYTRYDDTGLPTHDKDGKEVTKSMKKKLEKERTKFKKQLMKAGKK